MALPEDSQHPPNWSSDLFRNPAAHAAGVDRGLIGHVPIIAMLLIGQGVLELLFAVLGFGFLALVSLAPQKEFAGMRILLVSNRSHGPEAPEARVTEAGGEARARRPET